MRLFLFQNRSLYVPIPRRGMLDRSSSKVYELIMRSKRESIKMDQAAILAQYKLGQVVRHKHYEFRGVVFDVDPAFQNTEEWWESIPEEVRPSKDQPFYHLLAENETSYYVAYVSEQNLIPDETGEPVEHPEIHEFFGELTGGQYEFDPRQAH